MAATNIQLVVTYDFPTTKTGGGGIFHCTGAPDFVAAKGSMCVRSDGSSTSTRLYINTDGSTTWASVTTSA